MAHPPYPHILSLLSQSYSFFWPSLCLAFSLDPSVKTLVYWCLQFFCLVLLTSNVLQACTDQLSWSHSLVSLPLHSAHIENAQHVLDSVALKMGLNCLLNWVILSVLKCLLLKMQITGKVVKLQKITGDICSSPTTKHCCLGIDSYVLTTVACDVLQTTVLCILTSTELHWPFLSTLQA